MNQIDELYSEWSRMEYKRFIDIVTPIEFAFSKKIEAYVKLLDNELNGNKIISIGCGNLSFRDTWIGLDIDVQPLEIIRSKLSVKGNLIRGDASNLPFKDNVFDGVIASYVLEHIKNDDRAIQEIHRILTADGLAIIEVPYNPELFSVKDRFVGHFRRYDDNLIDYLKRYFTIKKIEKHGGGLLYYYWRFRNKLSSSEGMYSPSSTILRILILFLPIINRILYLGSKIPIGKKLFLSCVIKKSGFAPDN